MLDHVNLFGGKCLDFEAEECSFVSVMVGGCSLTKCTLTGCNLLNGVHAVNCLLCGCELEGADWLAGCTLGDCTYKGEPVKTYQHYGVNGMILNYIKDGVKK